MREGLLASHKPSQESGQPPPRRISSGLTWSLPATVFSPQPLPDLTPSKSSDFLLGLSVSLLTPWSCLTVLVALQVLGSESAMSKAPSPSPPPGPLPWSSCSVSVSSALCRGEAARREGEESGPTLHAHAPASRTFPDGPRGSCRACAAGLRSGPEPQAPALVPSRLGPEARKQNGPRLAFSCLFLKGAKREVSEQPPLCQGGSLLSPRGKFCRRGRPSALRGRGVPGS